MRTKKKSAKKRARRLRAVRTFHCLDCRAKFGTKPHERLRVAGAHCPACGSLATRSLQSKLASTGQYGNAEICRFGEIWKATLPSGETLWAGSEIELRDLLA